MVWSPPRKCTREVLQRIGFAQSTIFGDFWNFTVDTESTAEYAIVCVERAYVAVFY